MTDRPSDIVALQRCSSVGLVSPLFLFVGGHDDKFSRMKGE